MPLTRKQQILVKREGLEGEKETLAATDGLLVFNPSHSDNVSRNDRVPAAPTLSRVKDTVGRSSRQMTFEKDFVGTTDSATPTPPDWSELVEACGYREQRVKTYALATVTGSFSLGEKVFDDGDEAGEYGIALNNLTGDGNLTVFWLKGTAPAATIEGKRSGATGVAALAATNGQYAYCVTSTKKVNVVNGGWTGGSPPGAPTVGQVILVQRSGVVVAAFQILEDNGATMADINVQMQFGIVKSGDALTAPNGATATVSANSTQLDIPSLTFRYNRDGFARDTVGARGTFQLSAEAGAPLQFAFTFDGRLDTHLDTLLASGGAIGQLVPDRLIGITAVVGVGNVAVVIPIRRIEFDAGNTVAMHPNALASSGDQAAEIGDRDPTLTIGTDLMGKGALDWLTYRSTGTTIQFAMRLGTGAGKVLFFACPALQVIEAVDEDTDGIAAFTITFKPRAIDDGVVLEQGDNEVIFGVAS